MSALKMILAGLVILLSSLLYLVFRTSKELLKDLRGILDKDPELKSRFQAATDEAWPKRKHLRKW